MFRVCGGRLLVLKKIGDGALARRLSRGLHARAVAPGRYRALGGQDLVARGGSKTTTEASLRTYRAYRRLRPTCSHVIMRRGFVSSGSTGDTHTVKPQIGAVETGTRPGISEFPRLPVTNSNSNSNSDINTDYNDINGNTDTNNASKNNSVSDDVDKTQSISIENNQN
eukprot:m.122563 g.122563  ORF g.122563 m.122563 type:complete len:168 (-) comp28930_c1_seq1:677-1180(-)